MLTFVGLRVMGEPLVFVQRVAGGDFSPLLDRHGRWLDVYEWGYGGAGPRALARVLLEEVCRDRDVADRLSMEYKFARVAKLDRDFWTLGQQDVEEWIVARVASIAGDDLGDVVDLGGLEI